MGSAHGDDAWGWHAALALVRMRPAIAHRVRLIRTPADLCQAVAGVRRLEILDACRGLGPPGQLLCGRWSSRWRLSGAWSSSHAFDVASALELAKTLGELPATTMVWVATSEYASARSSEHLSERLQAALPAMVGRIAAAADRTLRRLAT